MSLLTFLLVLGDTLALLADLVLAAWLLAWAGAAFVLWSYWGWPERRQARKEHG